MNQGASRVVVLKGLFKQLCPPAFIPLARGLYKWLGSEHQNLIGEFESWEEAKRSSGGYQDNQILERVARAAESVRQGDAAFERDSVLFTKMDPPFPLLFGLLRCAVQQQGALHVLDFGGSLGSTYTLCRPFLGNLNVRWSIVEQAHYVRHGKKAFENEELRFFETIDAAFAAAGNVHVALVSGVLQYLDEPYEILARLAQLKIPIIIDRTPWSDSPNDAYTVQAVPPSIFEAKFPFRIFGRTCIQDALGDRYRCIASYQAVDPDMSTGKRTVKFSGWIFEPVEA